MVNRFSDKLLGFECNIPEGWAVMPGIWARKAKFTAAGTSEKLEALLKASTNIPFFNQQFTHRDPDKCIPMVQCTVKPLRIAHQLGGPDGVIYDVLVQMGTAFPDFHLI